MVQAKNSLHFYFIKWDSCVKWLTLNSKKRDNAPSIASTELKNPWKLKKPSKFARIEKKTYYINELATPLSCVLVLYSSIASSLSICFSLMTQRAKNDVDERSEIVKRTWTRDGALAKNVILLLIFFKNPFSICVMGWEFSKKMYS